MLTSGVKHLLLWSLFAWGTLTIAGCSSYSLEESNLSASQQGTLELSGSSTLGPLATEIGKRFERRNPGVRVEVQTGGSSRGISDAGTGTVDIGMSSRPLKDSERNGKVQWTIAHDGVCFIVHKQNPIKRLSKQQLIDIYSGKITHWNQLGGENAEIIVINRAAGRSELQLVTEFLGIGAEAIEADLVAGENQQGIKMVASNPHAITYMSVGASEFEASNGVAIKLLPLDDVPATIANVAADKFPLSRPLIFVTKTELSDLAKQFIDFARSEDVHDLVEGLSYVPVEQ